MVKDFFFPHVVLWMLLLLIVLNSLLFVSTLQIKREISIMKLVRHPYVVRLHEAWLYTLLHFLLPLFSSYFYDLHVYMHHPLYLIY